MRKTYRVRVDQRQYQIDLTEAEREQVVRHYHGFVSITLVETLDFEALAQEIYEEARA